MMPPDWPLSRPRKQSSGHCGATSGRCRARIEVGPLSRAESVEWLGRAEDVPREGATLAELFALRRGTPPAELPEPRPAGAGLYL